jgi:hypothetical protein
MIEMALLKSRSNGPDRRERCERERKAEPMAGGIDVTTGECVDIMQLHG